MTSSSSSTTSLALRELTLRQLEQTNDSLKFQLESLQSRHQSVLDAEERLTKRLQECETDMLKMRQQMEEAKRAEEKALKKMVHDMNEERELARKALVESEERVSSARREVAKLDDLLREATSRGESSSFFSSATTATTTTSTTSNKRAKRGLTGEEEQNHPEVDAERQRLELNELRRKVRELSAENEALQKGVAVSGRAQELASQLSVSQRNERALEEELRRTRRDHQETVPELKSQLTVANAKLKMLEATAREGEARAREAEEWREVFKFVLGETTSAVSTSSNVVVVKREVKDENDPGGEEAEGVSSPARRVVDMIIRLQRGSLECEMRCGKAESDLATCESRLASSNETLHRMETEMKTLRESERSAREGREELVRRLKRTELERDAAERIVTNWSSTTVDNLVDHRIALIGEAMRALKSELEEEKRVNEALRARDEVSLTTTTTTAPVRVLHLRPDVKLGIMGAAQQQQPQQQQHASITVPFTPRQQPPSSASALDTHPQSQAAPGTVDVDKRRERLKELFQKQILLFKEAVYLLLGFKIDMTPDPKPQVRVRSAFAESPDDFLLFRFHPETSAMELLETPYQSTFSPEQLTYLTKCHSVPAFLASLTLMLFERQTFAFS